LGRHDWRPSVAVAVVGVAVVVVAVAVARNLILLQQLESLLHLPSRTATWSKTCGSLYIYGLISVSILFQFFPIYVLFFGIQKFTLLTV